ncbi:hypothetical protein ColKHC_13182 [Colletotrichum higginsianum]|nr:hypothetical protein ColKHC_13182 [Colletotrichum higginsianum]
MGQYGGIISRGFALNFFVPGCLRTPYLDVSLETGPRAEHFARYLRLEELYVENESEHDDGDEPQTPAEMLLHNAKRGTTVRLTLTDGFPLLSILKTACTTADLNFITRDKAYSLFPIVTIQEHKLYPLSRLTDDFGRRLMEYAHHGWTTRDVIWPDWTRKKFKGMECRRVGDRFSLVVDFADNFDKPMSTPSHVIDHSQFEVLGTAITTGLNRSPRRDDDFLIEVKSLTSHALRHSFTIGVSTSWNLFLSQRLERWVLVELYKMGSTDRPHNFTTNVPPFPYQISLPASFTPPTTWDYADDQVATWYKEWESQ